MSQAAELRQALAVLTAENEAVESRLGKEKEKVMFVYMCVYIKEAVELRLGKEMEKERRRR